MNLSPKKLWKKHKPESHGCEKLIDFAFNLIYKRFKKAFERKIYPIDFFHVCPDPRHSVSKTQPVLACIEMEYIRIEHAYNPVNWQQLHVFISNLCHQIKCVIVCSKKYIHSGNWNALGHCRQNIVPLHVATLLWNITVLLRI